MAQEEHSTQRGPLVHRAYELLESLGQPTSEALLIQHLFGSGQSLLWKKLLHQTLSGSPLFEVNGDALWALVAWKGVQQALHNVDFVVFDTETTGLRPGPDRVIEIAGVRVRGGVLRERFQSLINPGRRLPQFIVKFTGITQDMLADAPPASVVIPEFLEFCEGAVLVGHNVGFDLRFLSHEAGLLDLTCSPDGLDTIPLARRYLAGIRRFKLGDVARHLQIPETQWHRALGDATVTAEIFVRLLERAGQQGIETLDHLRRRLQLPVAWSGDIKAVKDKKSQPWGADTPLSAPVISRPNGNLFLNPAWKQNFPMEPGVYLMKDKNDQVIYVGKAKCLKNRLNSYYSHPFGYKHSKVDDLIANIKKIETIVLGSELEALLVESRMIKELQPIYNVQLRNYELYPFIKIDVQQDFARVYATREVAADGARYFGPFRSRRLVDVTIELVQKIFPIRTCTRLLPPEAKPSEPCLRLHLGRCSAPCQGQADAGEYASVIEQVCAFLGGGREDLLERLRRQMAQAAQQLQFERAAWLRDAIRSAEEVLTGQRLISGAVEANNLLIVYPSALAGQNEIFLIRHGRLIELRRVQHESAEMESHLRAMLAHAASLPEPPRLVGKAEVDQINIISRWIHHHSDDRAFFPFPHTLTDESQIQAFIAQVWQEVEATRQLPFPLEEEAEPVEQFY